MKRALYPDAVPAIAQSKRQKFCSSLSSSSSPCRPQESYTSPPLTQEELAAFPVEELRGDHESISQWVTDCDYDYEHDPDTKPASPPLDVEMSQSGASASTRQRKKFAQRERQRSHSPSKDSPQYRNLNMGNANVYVDQYPDAPESIARQVEALFSAEFAEENEKKTQRVEELAREYQARCRAHAKGNTSGESVWRSEFWSLMELLSMLWTNMLKLNMGEKPWLSSLKPTGPSFEDVFGAAPQPPTPSDYPPFDNAPILSPSETSYGDPFSLTTPKPDITIGLSKDCLGLRHEFTLERLQEVRRVASDPHQSPIALRFPFLVVETKGLSSGMAGAQNQAAGDGACALNILTEFERFVEAETIPHNTFDSSRQIQEQDSDALVPHPMVLTVTTEGPVHELWVHYLYNEGYHMTLLGIWRPTFESHSLEFVLKLAKILEWGVSVYRKRIVGLLVQLEGMEPRRLREVLGFNN